MDAKLQLNQSDSLKELCLIYKVVPGNSQSKQQKKNDSQKLKNQSKIKEETSISNKQGTNTQKKDIKKE